MRKHIAVVMAVIMALSICGCGSSKSLFPENTGEQQETKTADSGSMKVGYLLSFRRRCTRYRCASTGNPQDAGADRNKR